MSALLALAVRSNREELGWTQAELAQATKSMGSALSTRTICHIESGERNMRLSTIEALAATLGTTPMGLLFEGESIARRLSL